VVLSREVVLKLEEEVRQVKGHGEADPHLQDQVRQIYF
jgi:hypothetical protein